MDIFSWLTPDSMTPFLAAFDSQWIVAGLFFTATAALIGFGMPGVLIPMALSSGAILGPWGAGCAVVLGAVAGSQLFFLSTRRFASDRLRARLGARLQAFEKRFADHGIWYVIGLRVVGAPHVLVTAGSALTPIRSSTFAAATLIGLLPAVSIAAATGSAI